MLRSYYDKATAITKSVNQQLISGATSATRRTPASYKNTHKRVRRLVQLKLIEEIKGHFERGAKYYRVSTYGLISYMGRVISESDGHIKNNKKDTVIQCLLLQFLEEKTIDSFYLLKEFPTMEIGDYLHDCCSVTISICKEIWDKLKRYQIEDILPSDEVIQKYMAYLDGKKVDKSILNEVIEYEKRLLRRCQINEHLRLFCEFRKKQASSSEKVHSLAFPIYDIYEHIVCRLRL